MDATMFYIIPTINIQDKWSRSVQQLSHMIEFMSFCTVQCLDFILPCLDECLDLVFRISFS